MAFGRRPSRLLAALAVASGAAAAPLPAGAQQRASTAEPVYLRLSPEPDRSLVYAHRIRAEMEAPPELGGSRSLTSRMRLRQTPVRVGADSLDLRIEVEAISVSADSVPGERLPDLTRHRGAVYLARLTTRGELVSMGGDGSGGGGVGRGGVSPVRRSVRMGGFPTLPDEPVRPGDSWVDTTRVEAGVVQGMMTEGTTVAVSRTTLEELRREGETRLAELSVVTSYSFERADSVPSSVRADMSGSGSSTVRFDVGNGRFLHAESGQDYTVNVGLPDSPRTLSVRFRVESEARLVEVGGAVGSP